MPKEDIEEEFRIALQPFTDLSEASSEEFKNTIESFTNNIYIIKNFLLKIKKELDEKIRYHEEFIKILEHISQNQNAEIKELKQKQIELISILRKETSLLDSCFLFFDRLENVLTSSEKKEKLQEEIIILVGTLKKEGKLDLRTIC